MASRANQKEAARQARLAAEQAAAERSARTRRLGTIAGVAVVAIIVAVVAIVVASNSGSKTSTGLASTPTAAKATYAAVASELHGIPQSGTTLGNPKAPVTIQYFGDLECPVCRAFSLGEAGGGLPQLISGPVRSGQVKLVYKAFETASHTVNNDRFVPQQVAALAAGQQGLFWDYAELFYHEQGSETTRYVTENYLDSLAKQIPTLNFAKWMSARRDAALAAQVQTEGKLALSYGLNGTPTLVALGPKAKEIVPAATGIPSYSEIQTAIKAVS
ncbi:MAG TPA: thioredoxin domain-containing protein [Solirubrobacteraceae bacterium]|nr:thioredoxin domain-containing protein [Solirubrobacteraceae bacterium]